MKKGRKKNIGNLSFLIICFIHIIMEKAKDRVAKHCDLPPQ